ncbi:alpha/beta hydrolase [Peteryoungia desertarenae]|uniref:alpha/beta hydrolase n=1 Tax=Peteryoungia desertarenae TaxID=1813451 RepID=UPI003CCCC030
MRAALFLFMCLATSAVALIVIYRWPPRLDLERDIVRNQPISAVAQDIETSLATSEKAFEDIRPNQHKQVIWADRTSPRRTPYSLVYVHGFSASSGEVRPLPDQLAAALGVNLYLTRLAGHGRSSTAMGEASIEAWAKDVIEAIEIGEAIGDQVILLSASTGSSLVTWALARPTLAQNVAATIFISPNYGVQAPGSFLLTGPFAEPLARLLIGDNRGFEPLNERVAANWTTSYPVKALIPMAQAVRLAAHTRVEDITVPALFLQSSEDKVIRPDLTASVSKRWGGPSMLVDPGPNGDPNSHVIAGDAFSPETTAAVRQTILDWLAGNGIQPIR